MKGMKAFSIILTILTVDHISSLDFDPYTPGPHEITRLFINSTTYAGVPTNLDIWAPVEPGTYPIVYFVDGYGGIVPGELYEVVMKKLASHGVSIVLPWAILTGLDADEKVPFIQDILDWCEDNLVNFLLEEGDTDVGFSIDFSMAFGLGHSAGSHVLCSYLTANCGPFKGWALLSPVDGADPWGIKDNFCTKENSEVNFELPTLIMPAGLDNQKGDLYVACAPDNISNRRFYNAMDQEAPKWMNNATYYGHADFMDPLIQHSIEEEMYCASNDTATEVALANYRTFVAGQVLSFMMGLQADNCDDYFKYLEDSDLMLTNVDVEFSVSATECPKAHCNWREANTTEEATTEGRKL